VALIDVEALAPGSYALELRLRRHPPLRRRLERLAAATAPRVVSLPCRPRT
jgi:hypothetical protein